MNVFAITGLFVGIPSVIVGIFTFLKSYKRVHYIWGLFSLSVALWGFGIYQIAVTTDIASSIFWWRIAEIGVIFIPVFLTHFVIDFLNLDKKLFISALYLIAFVLVYCDIFTNYFVNEVRFVFGKFYYITATLLYTLFICMFLGLAIYNIAKLWQAYKRTKGITKSQIKYLFIAFFIGFAGGATSYLPVYKIDILPVFNIAIFFSAAIVAYAIFKYRLMDIRLAIRRGTVFSGIVIAVTAIYVLAGYLLGWTFFGGTYTFKTQIITGLIVAVFTAVGFRPLYEWLKKSTDRFLFKGEYRADELMADISDFLSRTLDLNLIIQTLRDEIIPALRIKNMEVIVLEDFMEENDGKKELIPIKKIINCFKEQRDSLVLEELKRKNMEGNISKNCLPLIEELEKLRIALLIPLFIKDKLVGLFLLGAKKSGDMFTNEDIRTLEAIGSQAAIAVENARLYEEMKDFSKTLQKEVERQTKSLREANIRLQQLDQAKSEFISLASHQLRTPLSAIKGYISMMIEGSWGKVSKEQKENLEKVYHSNERLINLVEDLLTVSRIESGRLEFSYSLTSLQELTESVIDELKPFVEKKNLYLKYNKPKKPLPKVNIDQLKIRQVIQNLISNASQYTEQGGMTINLNSRDNKVIFSIQDTGIGISEEDKMTLFEKFSRGKGASKAYTEGTGLGLYLAAKLIQAHKGRIWVESKGKGKGSTFYFELPVGK